MLQVVSQLLRQLRISNHCAAPACTPRDANMCTALKKLRLERYLSAHGIMDAMRQPSRLKLSPNSLLRILTEATTATPIATTRGYQDEANTSGYGEESNLYAHHDDMHKNCGLAHLLRARIENAVNQVGLAADAQTMSEIRFNAGKHFVHERSIHLRKHGPYGVKGLILMCRAIWKGTRCLRHESTLPAR